MTHTESKLNGVAGEKYTPVDTAEPAGSPSKTFDGILEQIGTFGPRQRLIFFLISLAEFFGAVNMMLPVFVGAEPKWYCNTGGNVSAGVDGGNDTLLYKQCQVDGQACRDVVFRDDFSSIVSEWTLVCSKSYVSDLVTTIQMAGLMLGAALMGQVSDLIGRKKTFFAAFFFSAAGGLASGFAHNWQLYAACRFVVGFGFGGNQVVQVIYPMEFLGKRFRVLSGTVGIWGAGSLGLTLMAYFIRPWRTLCIATGALSFLYFLTWWGIPESPRWLIQHGRIDEADDLIKTIAKKKKVPTATLR